MATSTGTATTGTGGTTTPTSRTVTTRRLGRNLPRGRTLHLVDIENLAGDPLATATQIAAATAAYRAAMRVAEGDHVVIACNRGLVVEAGLAWPGAQLLPASGPDGADLALIDATNPAFVGTHYDRVVIGSGDGIFAGLVLQLRRLGMAVCVVARDGSLSAALKRAAGLTVCLAA